MTPSSPRWSSASSSSGSTPDAIARRWWNWRARGIALASHDDTELDHIDEAVRDGVAMSEFPTTLAAAPRANRA